MENKAAAIAATSQINYAFWKACMRIFLFSFAMFPQITQAQTNGLASDRSLSELNKLVQEEHYMDAVLPLSQQPALKPEVLDWLKTNAEAGYPLFQLEYSRRIWATDPQLALQWYARGYMIRSLDLSECTDRDRNVPIILIVQIYSALRTKALENPGKYASALDEAIIWEQNRKYHPSAKWLCGPSLGDDQTRLAARATQLRGIQESIAKLHQKSESK